MICLSTDFEKSAIIDKSADEMDMLFRKAVKDTADAGHLRLGVDVPGSAASLNKITCGNLFRMGLPGEEVGPLVSQFFCS